MLSCGNSVQGGVREKGGNSRQCNKKITRDDGSVTRQVLCRCRCVYGCFFKYIFQGNMQHVHCAQVSLSYPSFILIGETDALWKVASA